MLASVLIFLVTIYCRRIATWRCFHFCLLVDELHALTANSCKTREENLWNWISEKFHGYSMSLLRLFNAKQIRFAISHDRCFAVRMNEIVVSLSTHERLRQWCVNFCIYARHSFTDEMRLIKATLCSRFCLMGFRPALADIVLR